MAGNWKIAKSRLLLLGGIMVVTWALITTVCFAAGPDSSCFVPPIAAGLGADGPYPVVEDTFSNPLWKVGHVHLFHPGGLTSPAPVIFFCHKYGIAEPEEYSSLIRHLVSRGNVVVFAPTRRITFTRNQIYKYKIFFEGYTEAVKRFGQFIDTTRIGFLGHGFGGGAVPSLMHRALTECHWGSAGAFMYVMAPWYTYNIDPRDFQDFPGDVKVAVQTFDDDNLNDPRIGQDIYNSIAVPASEKTFLIVYGDHRGNCALHANDNVPQSSGSFFGEDDALDYYGVYRVVDALAAYSFQKDTVARDVIFSRGKAQECFMGLWPDSVPLRRMIAVRDPAPYFEKRFYFNRWNSPRNPRLGMTRHKTRKLFFSYYRNAWATYGRFIGGNAKRIFKEEDFEDTLPNPIFTGYGADSTFSWIHDSLPNPRSPELRIHLFRPAQARGPSPAIILLHGYIGQEWNQFESLISHVVSRGYAVMYPTYPFFPRADNEKSVMEKLASINDGIDTLGLLFGKYIDTTRVGFFGQSFGAGALPSVAYRTLTHKKWGNAGACLFITAPWYSFGITPQQLKAFPAHANLIMQIYDDDRINDHQIAVDLFNAFGTPLERKRFYTVFSDSSGGYVMNANHFVPYGVKNINGEQNYLDYYGVYKLFDALADYSFNNNEAGSKIAFGNGSKEQLFMGVWPDGRPLKPMEVTTVPQARHTEMQYMYAVDNRLNPNRNVNAPEKIE
jgi:dienelactone hydrolase